MTKKRKAAMSLDVPQISDQEAEGLAMSCELRPEGTSDFYCDQDLQSEKNVASLSEKFDVRTAPLMVPTLLEASAGTGKTFSIKHLVLRFAVEKGISVTQMLVMTFTKAATAELKARIQSHLFEMERLLAGEVSEEKVEKLLVEQRDIWRSLGITDDAAASRIRDSLASFDNAGIYTIHSFCQKALESAEFSSGGSIGFDLKENVDDLIAETVDEFLRREFTSLESEESRKELAECKDWKSILKDLSEAPRDLIPRELIDDEELQPEVQAALSRFCLEAPEILEGKKRLAHIKSFGDLLVGLRSQVLGNNSGPDEVAQAERFAAHLRSTYRAVLVDEFQDTDPVQFDIIRRLFLVSDALFDKTRAIWFVGDPKQAIYSFRSADLETYLQAKKLIAKIGRIDALGTNYRSAPKLVAAFNAFWKLSGNAFLRPDLKYQEVDASPTNSGLWHVSDGRVMEVDPFVWVGTWRDVKTSYATADDLSSDELTVLADRIVHMLSAGRRGELLLAAKSGEDALGVRTITLAGKVISLRALMPRDMAVLVRSNDEAKEVEQALKTRGVRVRRRSRDSVLKSEEAFEIKEILRAYAAPGDSAMLRAAQTTRLIGDDLSLMLKDESDQARRIELRRFFEEGARLWTSVGPAAVLDSLMTACHTADRLLPTVGGERALVNYRHLLELLHVQSRSIQTPSGLAAWLDEMEGNTSEDSVERLESDENLVLVQTIHSSKGLQYPVVFIPYAHKGWRNFQKSNSNLVTGESGLKRLQISLRPRSASEEFKSEYFQELIRLGYVGMTRAAQYLCLISGHYAKSKKSDDWSSRTMQSLYLMALTGVEKPSKARQIIEAVKNLQQQGFVQLYELDEEAVKGPHNRLPVQDESVEYSSALAKEQRSTWRTSSFTGISRMTEDDGPGFSAWYGEAERPAGDDILAFPKGAQAGTCLHEIMELADFSQFARTDQEASAKRLALCRSEVAKHLSFPTEEEAELAARGASQMVWDLLNAEMIPGMQLRNIPSKSRSAELEFLLPIPSRLTAKKLVEELAELDTKYDFGELREESLRGYLKGFIDLAFEFNGRFYVLDWKSNRISGTPEGYDERSMSDEMAKHLYRLQYLIYLVALRRFLKVRLGNAFQDDMIGGAIYVFLRGVRAGVTTPENPQGIVFDPVKPEVIARLDQLFSGDAA